jgi:peptidylprolyl isomerase domain and WD repeat-containing protein 1
MSALGKHPREDEPAAPDAVAVADDESSDDEGPMPMPADARATQVKKRRVVAHEKVYLNALPVSHCPSSL